MDMKLHLTMTIVNGEESAKGKRENQTERLLT